MRQSKAGQGKCGHLAEVNVQVIKRAEVDIDIKVWCRKFNARKPGKGDFARSGSHGGPLTPAVHLVGHGDKGEVQISDIETKVPYSGKGINMGAGHGKHIHHRR